MIDQPIGGEPAQRLAHTRLTEKRAIRSRSISRDRGGTRRARISRSRSTMKATVAPCAGGAGGSLARVRFWVAAALSGCSIKTGLALENAPGFAGCQLLSYSIFI